MSIGFAGIVSLGMLGWRVDPTANWTVLFASGSRNPVGRRSCSRHGSAGCAACRHRTRGIEPAAGTKQAAMNPS
jgi:hypothetical protein